MSFDEQGFTPMPAPEHFNPNKPIGASHKPSSYYDLMLSLSDLGSKEKGLKSQMEIADELRKTGMPQGRQAGRIYKAAHPMEFANSAVRQIMGGNQRRDVMSQQEQLANEIRRRIQAERERSPYMTPPTAPNSSGGPTPVSFMGSPDEF